MKTNQIFNNLALTLFSFLFILFLATHYTSIAFLEKTYTLNFTAEISILGSALLATQTLLYLAHKKNIINDSFLILLVLFFLYVFFWSLLNFVFDNDYFVLLATLQSLETLILWFALLFIGYNLRFDSKLKYLILSLFWLSLISTIIFSIRSNTVMIYTKIFFGGEDVEVGYQYLSRALLVVVIFSSAFIEKDIGRNILLIVGAYLLFTIGSRSEFFAFIFSIIFIFGISIFRKGVSFKYVVGLAFFFSLLAIILYKYLDIFLESRFSEVLNVDSSASWSARGYSQEAAIKQIEASPLLGEYAGHINENGIRGYSHNILSAWVNYGLIGFLIYFSLILYSFLYSLRLYLKSSETSKILWITTTLSLVLLVLVIFSKPVFWPLPALVWGLLLRLKLKSNLLNE